jgi:hypothetical protein
MAKPLSLPMLPLTLPLVFNKPSSQAPAVSLKNSLYAGLHLDPPLAIAVEPHGCSVWRRHREWREVWQASGRGMAFLLSHPEQSEQTRLGKCSGLGWVSGLLSKDVPLQVLGHRQITCWLESPYRQCRGREMARMSVDQGMRRFHLLGSCHASGMLYQMSHLFKFIFLYSWHQGWALPSMPNVHGHKP